MKRQLPFFVLAMVLAAGCNKTKNKSTFEEALGHPHVATNAAIRQAAPSIPLVLVDKKILTIPPTSCSNLVYFFDADNNTNTIEYIGKVLPKNPQQLADFENVPLGTPTTISEASQRMLISEVAVHTNFSQMGKQ